MFEIHNDTIAAIATPVGVGGIAIVRLSGGEAEDILQKLFIPAKSRECFASHELMYGRCVDADGGTLDEVMAVLMRAPRSYTREDVAEIHCHGGGVSAGAVLSRCLALGARMAQPGEFTKRAFLNGRIDLSRAEAVMQLIGAQGEAAARASVRQLEGGVSAFVKGVSERDERGARVLREGASIVLAGRPNVGKSSLMNALLNQERAIVTAIPGTTRDVLTERISLGGVVAELSDTAGQRDTSDPIEKLGVERAQRAAERADVVLIVLDAAEALDAGDAELVKNADGRAVICLNKSDLKPVLTAQALKDMTGAKILEISARTGEGIAALVDELNRRVAPDEEGGGVLTVQRHIELAKSAADSLELAARAVEEGLPLDTAAIDLRLALASLAEITGENATEAVIDRVFSDFCVGK